MTSTEAGSTTSVANWFLTSRHLSGGWRFDVVGLLAVIGESSIQEYRRAIVASRLSSFPRLIPAPQALLHSERPRRLPSIKDVDVVGVFSGMRKMELNYFANAIHNIQELKDHEFRVYNIDYQESIKRDKALVSNTL